MESSLASVSGALLFTRPSSTPSASISGSRRRYLLASRGLRSVPQGRNAARVRVVSKQQIPRIEPEREKNGFKNPGESLILENLLGACRSAIVFVGSSVLLLLAGLGSSRLAFAQPGEAVATVETTQRPGEEATATSEKATATSEKADDEESQEEFDDETKEELRQALVLIREDKKPELIELLKKLMAKQPKVLEIHFMLGQVYDWSGDLESALNVYEEILSVEPLSLQGLERLAVVSARLGKSIDHIKKIVEEAAEKATNENETDESIAFRLLNAKLLTLKGDLKPALELYQQLSKDAPTDYRPHLCQGLVLCALGDAEEAEYHFRIFNRLCPEDCLDRDLMEEEIKVARENVGDIRHTKTLK